MMTEDQIQCIKEKGSIFEPCIKFAVNFIPLPNIVIHFDDCPSQRFPTMDNAAEGGWGSDRRGHVYINGPWFADRIEKHQDDVEFFFFHELRHIYQHSQICLLETGNHTREPIEVVKKWKDGFNNYIRNMGGDSQLANISQEVEIDANAYGILLEYFYRNCKSPLLSILEEARNLADERLQSYVDTLPEFQRYIQQVTMQESAQRNRGNTPIVKGKKVGRNEKCPCGSGKKYKHCCGRPG